MRDSVERSRIVRSMRLELFIVAKRLQRKREGTRTVRNENMHDAYDNEIRRS